MPASACSCWSLRRSSSWPLPSCCAASASAAKATTTRCRPKDAVRVGAQSRSEDGPSLSFFFFSFLFNPFFLTFSSSHQLQALHIFWAEPAPAPAASGSVALHERGMGEKAKPAPWPEKRCGRGVKGSEEVRLDAVDRHVHVLGDLI